MDLFPPAKRIRKQQVETIVRKLYDVRGKECVWRDVDPGRGSTRYRGDRDRV
jgi:hypothetical protein